MSKITTIEKFVIEAPLWIRFMLLFKHKQHYDSIIDHRDHNKGVHVIRVEYKTYKNINYIISKELVKVL